MDNIYRYIGGEIFVHYERFHCIFFTQSIFSNVKSGRKAFNLEYLPVIVANMRAVY